MRVAWGVREDVKYYFSDFVRKGGTPFTDFFGKKGVTAMMVVMMMMVVVKVLMIVLMIVVILVVMVRFLVVVVAVSDIFFYPRPSIFSDILYPNPLHANFFKDSFQPPDMN